MNTEAYFLHLISYNTQSDPKSNTVPSTAGQKILAEETARMLRMAGVPQVQVSEKGYVYGRIPATAKTDVPAIGFIAHLDTSPDCSGAEIHPQIIPDYDGGDLLLHAQRNLVLSVEQFPHMAQYRGKRLIVTDGTTLLGGDDKAGIAEILTMAEELLKSALPHGEVDICFTPDEEIGRGTDFFEPECFGASMAYTVDGGACGTLQFENFYASSASVKVHGVNIHPGAAKNKMKNAACIAMEFHRMLPVHEVPEATSGYEGFAHLTEMHGTVEEATLEYILRDHDRQKLEQRKKRFWENQRFLNQKYGENTVQVEIQDTYANMKEMILPHYELIDLACEAMERVGVKPEISPIRGGTDGAKLSYMGIPCPNLGTGSGNHHGRFEYAVVDEMDAMVRILLNIVDLVARKSLE